MFPEKYPSCLEWVKTVFSPEDGFELDLLDEDNLNWINYNSYDALYIGGWNTYRLLKLIRETWLDQIIKSFAEEKVVYGGSAGALILSKTIDSCADLNLYWRSWEQLNWLDLIGWNGVICHYKKSKSVAECLEFSRYHNGRYFALPEEGWIRYEQGSLKPYGEIELLENGRFVS